MKHNRYKNNCIISKKSTNEAIVYQSVWKIQENNVVYRFLFINKTVKYTNENLDLSFTKVIKKSNMTVLVLTKKN